MKIFKFGGASVKDAASIKNVVKVLESTQEKNVVIIISAMGKMTNALEKVIECYFKQPEHLHDAIHTIKVYHENIISELFPNNSHPIYKELQHLFKEISLFLKTNKSQNYSFVYDQIVGYGELLSTKIVTAYFTLKEIENTWIDVRNCIATNNKYRDASINWVLTQEKITQHISKKGITITQGFLGAEQSHNFTTTLGREGSDYTAAIFAYCLNAINVTIWKDVPGVLNADPRYFDKTTLLHHISYKEAIELAFYGASVIHPKTLQPLQRKEIPLYVKSFLDPEGKGTCVGKGVAIAPKVSCFILKRNQILISLSSLDFNFMMEHHIGNVFQWLSDYKMKVDLIQNSAISFSVCVDNKYNTLEPLLKKLRATFRVKWNEGVTLYTVRHASPKEIKTLTNGKEILLKQESRDTVQLVVKE